LNFYYGSDEAKTDTQTGSVDTLALQHVQLQVMSASFIKLTGLCWQTASEAADERRPECQVEVRKIENA